MKIRSKESQSKRYAVNRYVSADYVFSIMKMYAPNQPSICYLSYVYLYIKLIIVVHPR